MVQIRVSKKIEETDSEDARKQNMPLKRAALVRITNVILLLVGVMGTLGETVRLNPVADTTLFQTDPNNSLGGVNSLAVGTTAAGRLSRALIKFDLAGKIPPNATITSVTLIITALKAPTSGGRGSVIQLNRVLQDWGEGNQAGGPRGAPAKLNDATWNARFHPGVGWSKPGAAAPADFLATASAATSISGLGEYQFSSTTQLVSDVQSWLTKTAGNFGWILLSQSEGTPETARRIGAREHETAAPVLVVDYSLPKPAQPFRLDIVEKGDNQLQIHFQIARDTAYVVEYTESLSPILWKVLTNLASQVTATNVIITDILSGQHRFYRARSFEAPR